jgi:ribonuclease D
MSYRHVTSDRELAELCQALAKAPTIAFDTEFVSEHSFRPQLCLIQVAAGDELAVIDTLSVRHLAPFWQLLAAPRRRTIVHSGREELLFCVEAVQARPANLVDVQIAAGLVGYEYPAGYGSLLFKLLGQRPHKGETRTDWRKRPLTAQQIDYALDDVRYLEPLWDQLAAHLGELGRVAWMDDEMRSWQDEVERSRGPHRWWRVSGISGLSRRSLAIVREVWNWREQEAARRDCPVRRVLRDDLIVELAKRRSADPKQLRAVRGMERGDLLRIMPQLAAAVARGLAVPDEHCPEFEQRESPAHLTLLGQFIASALTSVCRSARLAPSIVGTASDVRDLVGYRLGMDVNGRGEPPLLGRGWRAEVIGRLIDELLAGQLAIRVRDPHSDEPLAFEPLAPPRG